VRVQAIDAFVRGGGTAVFWNQGTASAIAALQRPVRNVVAGVPRSEYFTGVSIMRVIVDRAHPGLRTSGLSGDSPHGPDPGRIAYIGWPATDGACRGAHGPLPVSPPDHVKAGFRALTP
jgi:hypothetical protein